MTIPPQYTPAPGQSGWPPQQPEWSQQHGWQQNPYHAYGNYQQPPQQPPRRKAGAFIVAGVAALALTGAAGFAAGWELKPASQSTSAASYLPLAPAQQQQQGGSDGSGSDGSGNAGSGSGAQGSGGAQGSTTAGGATSAQVAAVAAKVDPALVDINTVLGAQNAEAAGTGIVLTADGVILTNNHVVAGATSISVTDIGNHRTYQAAVVGYDRSGDIAVLQLKNASGLTTATLATSAVSAGQAVVAIGNAGGTGGTPSAVGGVVSALGQSITASDESSGASEKLTGLIEVNADIEAGDSGGPLLTTDGQVIGVDTAASAGFQYQSQGGDGFAIPISTATTVATQIRGGKSSDVVHIGATAYLGIETAGTQSRGSQNATGPTVLGVVDGTPAASAGLARGDVITSLGGNTVDSATTLTGLLDRYHPGDKVKIGWTDLDGQSHTATVTLAGGPVG